MNLQIWREEIDSIDREILHLLEQRAATAAKIGAAKAAANLPVIDEERERQVLSRIAPTQSVLSAESARCVFRCIIEESRRIQTKIVGQKTKIW